MVADVIHMVTAFAVKLLQESIGVSVKVGGKHVKASAKFDIKGRRRLYPLVVQIEDRITVIQKKVLLAHESAQSLRAKMVDDIR